MPGGALVGDHGATAASTFYGLSGVRLRDRAPTVAEFALEHRGPEDDLTGRSFPAAALYGWRTDWRTKDKLPANKLFKGGLENRYPS